MKLWLIHHYAIPPTESGITRHYQLAHELKKLGHSPVLIAADIHHRSSEKFRLPSGTSHQLDTTNDIPLLRLRCLTSSASSILRIANMLAFAWRLFRRSGFEALEKADLIIGCTPDLFSAVVSCHLAKKYKVPFVFHVGEIWPLMLTEVGNAPRWHPFVLLLGFLEKYLYRHADMIIAAQPKTCDHIAERGGSKGEVVFVPNGVDLASVPPPQIAHATGGKFKIMYTGALGRANGMDEILASAGLLKDKNVEFIFLGDGPLRAQLMQKAASRNLENVTFLPPVPKSSVYGAMAVADAFIVNVPDKKPYQYGLAHNKVFDYMAMVRPIVIATNTAENPITEYDAGILVSANDAEGMSKAILRLSEMTPSEREAMGRRGRRGIEEKYNFSNLGKMLEVALMKAVIAYKHRHT